MMCFWRLIFSVIIAFSLIFLTPLAYSLPINNNQITPSKLFKLGVNQMQRDNYETAIDYFNLVIQMENRFIAAYDNRCLAYLQIQNYHQAVISCSQAINLKPDDSEAYLNRGLAQYRQGNYQDAIADYNQALTLKPDDFRVYYNRGIVFAKQGNYSQAISDYNRALIEINLNHNLLLADIYNDRGLAYFKLHNLPEAISNFNLAIDLNSDNDRAFFNRGCICGRTGDNLGARNDFSQVIKLNPSNALAYLNRGLANYNLGYYEKAIADLQQASVYFEKQGQKLAHQKTLDFLKIIQIEISSMVEIV